jgi:ribosomal protein S18 acetylase RimI-like enzyme
MRIQQLDWDTEFFGFRVGRLIDVDRQHATACILQHVQNSGCRVVYVATETLQPDLAEHYVLTQVELELGFARWVEAAVGQDQRDLPFSGSPDTDTAAVSIEEYQGPADADLHKLALQAGWSSRFSLDPRFGRASFESLYAKWIQRSCSREIADVVLTASLGPVRIGFITGSLSLPKARVGLIAVDGDSRGLGVGRQLMEGFAALAFAAGCSALSVVTQAENVSAVRLYSRVGFEEVGRLHWYHIWSESGESA